MRTHDAARLHAGTDVRPGPRALPPLPVTIEGSRGSAGAELDNGVVRHRRPLATYFNAWRKHTPLNPYWLELGHLRRAVESLAAEASGRMLDVGVGERPWGALFDTRVTRYVGLEYPPVADHLSPGIWQALERLRGIVDVFGDGARLPFRSETYDTVLAVEVLEHVPDPSRCVAEFARVLKPGGRLLVTVPFTAARHQLPFDYARFTAEGVTLLLERHGFEIERLTPRGNSASVAGTTLAHLLLRTLAASSVLKDGSVTVSRWRGVVVLPLIALTQMVFALVARVTRDDGLCLGHTVVARKKANRPTAPGDGLWRWPASRLEEPLCSRIQTSETVSPVTRSRRPSLTR